MPTTTSPVKASRILALGDSIKRQHRILLRIEALMGFVAYATIFKEAGLTDGVIEISESNDDGNRYEIEVYVTQATTGMSDEGMLYALLRAVDTRDLAEEITNYGKGEFFTETINFATFDEDWVAPLRREIESMGVEIDSLERPEQVEDAGLAAPIGAEVRDFTEELGFYVSFLKLAANPDEDAPFPKWSISAPTECAKGGKRYIVAGVLTLTANDGTEMAKASILRHFGSINEALRASEALAAELNR